MNLILCFSSYFRPTPVFPPYFGFLHKYIANMMKSDSLADEKVIQTKKDFNKLLQTFTGNSW